MKGDIDFDFILSIVLFLIIYIIIFQTISFLTLGARETPDIYSMEIVQLSEQFMKSAGSPEIWDLANVTKLGFAYYNESCKQNILDYNKIILINNTDCSNLTEKTATTVKFNIKFETNNYVLNCSNAPKSTARIVERSGMVYDGNTYEPIKMRLYVWSNM